MCRYESSKEFAAPLEEIPIYSNSYKFKEKRVQPNLLTNPFRMS